MKKLTRGFHDRRKRLFWIVTDRQTHTQTDGHGNSMTESAQWGQFSVNQKKVAYIHRQISELRDWIGQFSENNFSVRDNFILFKKVFLLRLLYLSSIYSPNIFYHKAFSPITRKYLATIGTTGCTGYTSWSNAHTRHVNTAALWPNG